MAKETEIIKGTDLQTADSTKMTTDTNTAAVRRVGTTGTKTDIGTATLTEIATETRTRTTGGTEMTKTAERRKEAGRREALRVCRNERSMRPTKCVLDLDCLPSGLSLTFIV